MSEEKLLKVELDKIHVPAKKLRGEKTEDEGFQEIKATMDRHGLNTPILLRPYVSPPDFDENNNQVGGGVAVEGEYFVVEGLQRLTAARQLGWESIDAKIAEMDEIEAFKRQVFGNHARVDTTTKEFANAIAEVFSADPTMTLKEVAKEFGQSPDKIAKTLALTKMPPEVWEALEDGSLKVSNAYVMCKLDEKHVPEFLERGKAEKTEQFIQSVAEQVSKDKEAKKKAKDTETIEWKPRAKSRGWAWMLNEFNSFNDTGTAPEGPSELTAILQNEYPDIDLSSAKPLVSAITAIYASMNPSEVEKLTKEHEAKQAAKAAKAKAKATDPAAKLGLPEGFQAKEEPAAAAAE